MRILVTGAKGMLGQDIVAHFRDRGHEVMGVDLEELDITDPVAVGAIGAGEFGKLDWLVNCAAYTAVDKAESEPRLAHEINALAPGYLAQATALSGAGMVHISTDFVFDGRANEPYAESDPTSPLGVYGHTKRDGERAALAANPRTLVFRTAWLYGSKGKSFPLTMITLHRSGKQLRVVADQRGNPTYTEELARVVADAVALDAPPGIYHATGPETMSWHEFAGRAISAATGGVPEIEPIPTSEYPTPAQRPAYSALSFAKLAALGIEPMEPVDDSLRRFVARVGESLALQ